MYIFKVNVYISESCLNQHLLRQPNGETKWRLPTGNHVFSVQLVLPRGLTCSQCVLQWKWNTGDYIFFFIRAEKTSLILKHAARITHDCRSDSSSTATHKARMAVLYILSYSSYISAVHVSTMYLLGRVMVKGALESYILREQRNTVSIFGQIDLSQQSYKSRFKETYVKRLLSTCIVVKNVRKCTIL